MYGPTKNKVLSLLFLFLLAQMTEATVGMTVQVTLIPKAAAKLPICSLPLLRSLQPFLTSWVIEATKPDIPDFHIPQQILLTYRNPSRGRRLGTSSTKSRRVSVPESCVFCTSSGCSQHCGYAMCNRCGSSRRLNDSENRTKEHDAQVDFDALGKQVSERVQTSAQAFLMSQVVDVAFGCLGNPSPLAINVKFLVNQTSNA